jgi:type IV pilus assembly protein PilY1
LGYVFDAPTLVKTKAYGWVALVASGYNNVGGKGYLYVLNPNSGGKKSGELLAKIALPGDTGTDESPTGLSTVRAFTPSRKDPYVLQAYGGDLKGNVWRFDLSDSDPSKWKAERIAKLTDPSGNPQPITTGVRVEIDQTNNVDRYFFVGTGKLLHPDDLYDSSVRNTLYVIRDGTKTVPDPAPAELVARKRILNSVDGTSKTGFTGKAIGPGWYQDATDANEKIVTDVIADVQTVVAVFSKPSADPCAASLTSTLYAREFLSGNSVIQSAGGDVKASITDIGAIAGVSLIQGQAQSGGVGGDVRIQVTTMKGQVVSFGVQLTGGSPLKHRVSWRLIKRD